MPNNKRPAAAVGVGIGVIALLIVIIAALRRPDVAQAATSPTTREIPLFQVDPAWPKIPNGWSMGQVSSIAADTQDNIWVLQRPKTVRIDQKAPPPVMEFDQAGNYIKGWGGPGQGYDWPQTEHGIYIDYKGFVWIGGSGNEDQILKFTQDGKFVMQIGHGGHKKTNADTENFWKPADVFVYAKTNELFVADGYGNKRVIVFDADTGQFKRMWGAYGKPPEDSAAPPAGGEGTGPAAGGRGRGGPGDTSRIPAKALAADDPRPEQFDTVHGIKVSNDGLVYVADRGGKRVQVFTTDGKYITQAWIDRWCEAVGQACGNGQTAASVALSADPQQQYLYVASRSPARIWVYDRKTMQPLYYFGSPGVAPGQFYALHEMVTDTKGNLYTTEVEDGRRAQKFVFKGIEAVPITLSPTPVVNK